MDDDKNHLPVDEIINMFVSDQWEEEEEKYAN